MNRFSIILPVWGKLYTDTFVNYSLPSLMAQTLAIDSPNVQLLIATDDATADYMKCRYNNSLCRLNTIFLITEIQYDCSPHKVQTRLYRAGLTYLSSQNSEETNYAIFITPDIILPATALEAVVCKVRAGFMCCYMLGLRLLDTEETRCYLDTLIDGESLRLSTWQLIELAYQFMHPQTEWLTINFYWIRRPMNRFPHLYLKTARKFFAKGFHLHPLFLKVPKRISAINDTIDGDFIGHLGFTKDQIGFFDDSQPIASLDLAPIDRFKDQILYCEPINAKAVWRFGIQQTYFQRNLFKHIFCFCHDSEDNFVGCDSSEDASTTLTLDRFQVSISAPLIYWERFKCSSIEIIQLFLRRLFPGRIGKSLVSVLRSRSLSHSSIDYYVEHLNRLRQ